MDQKVTKKKVQFSKKMRKFKVTNTIDLDSEQLNLLKSLAILTINFFLCTGTTGLCLRGKIPAIGFHLVKTQVDLRGENKWTQYPKSMLNVHVFIYSFHTYILAVTQPHSLCSHRFCIRFK